MNYSSLLARRKSLERIRSAQAIERNNKRMKNQKNELVTQTPEQRSPGLARPEDFVIENEQLAHGGQCGETKREYNALLKVGPKSRGVRAKGKSNIEAR